MELEQLHAEILKLMKKHNKTIAFAISQHIDHGFTLLLAGRLIITSHENNLLAGDTILNLLDSYLRYNTFNYVIEYRTDY